MGRWFYAFVVLLLTTEVAAAQCYAPSQSFVDPRPRTLIQLQMDAIGFADPQDVGEALVRPWGAGAPYISVHDAAEFRARLLEWRRGEGLAPILSVDEAKPGDWYGATAALQGVGGENLSLSIEAPKRDIETGFLLHTFRNAVIGTTGSGLAWPWGSYRPEDFGGRPSIEQVTGEDQSRPLPVFQQPRPAPGSPPAPPVISDLHNASNETSAAISRAFNAVVHLDIGGFPCNGVHVGQGRIATNLHCAVNNARARVLFGPPFRVAGKWYAPLVCNATSVWPVDAQATLAQPREDLALYQVVNDQSGLAAPSDPHPVFVRFSDADDFSDVSFAPGAIDPWAAQFGIAGRPLIALQVWRRPPPFGSTQYQFERRVEDGRWQNSSCAARATPHAAHPPCELGTAVVTAGGVEHGCDGEEGSSAMPLFVDDGQGNLVLVGLHRGGAGAEPGQEATEYQRLHVTWNCALPARSIAQMIASYERGGR